MFCKTCGKTVEATNCIVDSHNNLYCSTNCYLDISDKPTTFSIAEAFKKLEEGYAIRKIHWGEGCYIYKDEDGMIRWGHTELLFTAYLNVYDKWELF